MKSTPMLIGAVVVGAALAAYLAFGMGRDGSTGGSSRLERLMALVPDTAETRVVVEVIDYEALRGAAGVPRPPAGSDDEANEAYVDALRTAAKKYGILIDARGRFLSGAPPDGDKVIKPSNVGYGFANVEGSVFAGAPPQIYEAVVGDFNPAASKRAIHGCQDCPDYETQSFRGVRYYSWGEDLDIGLQRRLKPPAFDALGRGGRIVFEDGFILRALWTDGIKGMIDASKGKHSLGSDEHFAGIARAADASGAWLLLVYEDYQVRGRIETRESIKFKPYEAAGIGYLLGPGADTLVVMSHSSSEAARENAQRLGRLLQGAAVVSSGQPAFESIDVGLEGKIVTARLTRAPGVPASVPPLPEE